MRRRGAGEGGGGEREGGAEEAGGEPAGAEPSAQIGAGVAGQILVLSPKHAKYILILFNVRSVPFKVHADGLYAIGVDLYFSYKKPLPRGSRKKLSAAV
jgi:hypothetical protein